MDRCGPSSLPGYGDLNACGRAGGGDRAAEPEGNVAQRPSDGAARADFVVMRRARNDVIQA